MRSNCRRTGSLLSVCHAQQAHSLYPHHPEKCSIGPSCGSMSPDNRLYWCDPSPAISDADIKAMGLLIIRIFLTQKALQSQLAAPSREPTLFTYEGYALIFYTLAFNESKRNFKVARFFAGAGRDLPRSSSTRFCHDTAEPTIPGCMIRAEPELTLKRAKHHFGFISE